MDRQSGYRLWGCLGIVLLLALSAGIYTLMHLPAGASVTAENREAERAYVLNLSSRKIHLPECKGVQSMSPKNREEIKATLGELISWGYEPCKQCNPEENQEA